MHHARDAEAFSSKPWSPLFSHSLLPAPPPACAPAWNPSYASRRCTSYAVALPPDCNPGRLHACRRGDPRTFCQLPCRVLLLLRASREHAIGGSCLHAGPLLRSSPRARNVARMAETTVQTHCEGPCCISRRPLDPTMAAVASALPTDQATDLMQKLSLDPKNRNSVAEMIGPVDFNKTLDYWQHDKWIGCAQ